MDFKALASKFSFSPSSPPDTQSAASGPSGDDHTAQRPTVTIASDPPVIAAPAPVVVHSNNHSAAPILASVAPPPVVNMTPTSSSTITAEPLPVLSPSPAAAAAAASAASDLLYHNKGALNVGQVMRYKITYTPADEYACADEPEPLWLKIRNLEVVALRAAYLAGPFILYVDVRPEGYDPHKKVTAEVEQPYYEPQLKAGQSFYAPLHVNEPAAKRRRTYTWTVDIVSQIIFSISAQVQYEISVGRTKNALQSISLKGLQGAPTGSSRALFGPLPGSGLLISSYDTLDLWSSPVPKATGPLHLVVITHGLHSNTGADMLYAKEAIDAKARKTGENVIVRGYFGNVRKTEKGVRYLGRRLAEWIVQEVANQEIAGPVPVSRISFIAHSMGGLVQTYAIAHIATHHPDFFERIEPVNFIALATPFLGISNENPYYVKFALDIGFVGKSGQDLSLAKPLLISGHSKPLLRILPTGPTHVILKKFLHRTLYANAVNDGIVPLRTSAILYLDWSGLGKVGEAIKEEMEEHKKEKAAEEEEIVPMVHPHHHHHRHGLFHHREDSQERTKGRVDSGISSIMSSSDTSTTEAAESKGPADAPGSPQSVVGEIPERYDELPAIELSNTSHDEGGGALNVEHKNDSNKASSSAGSGVIVGANPNAANGIFSGIFTPMQSIFSIFAPSSQRKTPKIYKHSQTLPISPDDDVGSYERRRGTEGNLYGARKGGVNKSGASTSGTTSNTSTGKLEPYIPPKTGVLESGVSVLLPPLPPDAFILDPAMRPETIVHDRMYHDYDLPPRRLKRHHSSRLGRKKGEGDNGRNSHDSERTVDRSKVEERIARDWHKELEWRKVLVHLEPDAHNNIIVRRRFANAYGWPVIDHLVEAHFGGGGDELAAENDDDEAKKHEEGIKDVGRLGRGVVVVGAAGESGEKYFQKKHKGINGEAMEILKRPVLSQERKEAGEEAEKSREVEGSKEHELGFSGMVGGGGTKEGSSSEEEDYEKVESSEVPTEFRQQHRRVGTFTSIGTSTSTETSTSSSSSSSGDGESRSSVEESNSVSWGAYLGSDNGGGGGGGANLGESGGTGGKSREEDNAEEGILHQMGNMFDSIREIGNLNFGALGISRGDEEEEKGDDRKEEKDGDGSKKGSAGTLTPKVVDGRSSAALVGDIDGQGSPERDLVLMAGVAGRDALI